MKTNRPLVSILISTKNRTDYLVNCLKSTIEQTYAGLEILVLDDNSDVDISSTVSKKITDERITFIRSDITLGVTGTRNRLLTTAKGDIFVVIDDDARFREDNALQKIVDYFDSHHDTGLLSLKVIDIVNGEEVGVKVPFRKAKILKEPESVNTPQYVSYFIGAGHALTREAFEKCGLYQDDFMYGSEELDLSYRMIENQYKLMYYPDIVIEHYPQSFDPLTKTKKTEYLYFTMRNKIWVEYKYLPWYAFLIKACAWSAVMIVFAFRNGGFADTLRGIKDGFGKLGRLERTPISKSTIEYLKSNNGRMFF